MSGGASLTMILTSTGIAYERLQDGSRALNVGLPLRRVSGFRQNKIVLRQCDHQFCIILNPSPHNRAACAKQARCVITQCFKLSLLASAVHGAAILRSTFSALI